MLSGIQLFPTPTGHDQTVRGHKTGGSVLSTRILFRHLFLIACFTLLAASVEAQSYTPTLPDNMLTPADPIGIPPGSSSTGTNESIGLSNGSLNIFIPALSLPQRGGWDLTLGLVHHSTSWHMQQNINIVSNPYVQYNYGDTTKFTNLMTNYPNHAVALNLPQLSASIEYVGDLQAYFLHDPTTESAQLPVFCVMNWVFTDWSGNAHPFSNIASCSSETCNIQASFCHSIPGNVVNLGDSTDGAWLRLDTSNKSDIRVFTKDGTVYHFTDFVDPYPGAPTGTLYGPISDNQEAYYQGFFSSMSDPHGNTVTFSASSAILTDTIGRKINTANGFSYTDSNGKAQAITFNTTTSPTTQSYSFPNLSCQYIGQDYPAPFVTPTVTTPNQTFNFAPFSIDMSFPPSDSTGTSRTYHMEFDGLDRMTKIVYPSGGYTRYDYQDLAATQETAVILCFRDFIEVAHKYESPSGSAAQEFTTTYNPGIGAGSTPYNGVIDVIDPAGTRTHHVFAIPSYYSQIGPRETDTSVYNSAGTLLRSIHTDYTPAFNYADFQLPATITTTLNDVSPALVSKQTRQYDSTTLAGPAYDNGASVFIDNPIEIDEYDFGATAPTRKTAQTWAPPTYFTPAHILDRLASRTVTDSLSGVQSTLGYIYNSVGDLSIKNVGGTGVATLSTGYLRDSYGNVTQITDPVGNVTKFGYQDTWAETTCAPGSNSSAYLTSITDALNHVTNFSYDSCTGARASATDPNGARTSLLYDALGRTVSTTLPGGGQSTNSYVDAVPSSVTSTSLITSSLSRISKTILDGFARPIQSQLLSDPDGTTYVDTTYDALGRRSTVSNPYRATTESTYGITTYQYDALSRVTKVVPPDGTSTSNNVTSTYSGNVTTAADQAGKSRTSQTDALGRLIEVDEPSGASAATAGAGSATISGAERNIQQSTAAPGTGSATANGSEQSVTSNAVPGVGFVSISGSEKSVQTPTPGTGSVTISGAPACASGVCQTGTVYITVKGFTASVNYANTTAYTIASGLASALNTSSSPVTATVTTATYGSIVNLRSKATGTSSNYSLSAGTTFRGPDANPAFDVSTSDVTLTGGSAGQNVYDTGKIIIFVNGSQASLYAYGQTDTPTSIASGLVTALSSSLVNASASGGVITLTAKTAGSSTNYSLSTAVIYDQTNFSSASFSATSSGAALAGGKNSVTTYDIGSVWVSVNGMQYSTSYGQGDTSAAVASRIASAVSAGSLANASASGSTITLTAKTNGPSTNYSLSSGSSTSQPGTFSGPSFSVSVSGATLTGGTDTVIVYDAGTVSVTVDGYTASYSYGQADTPSTISSALASSLNNSPYVTASASGAVISFTAKTTGSATNYTLSSAASSSQPATFSPASFAASASGSALTGGADAVPNSLATPAVTLYSYDALGNLTCVEQHGNVSGTGCSAPPGSDATSPWRVRRFTYNSLSQLTNATNPESRAIAYAYDNNGNVLTKTDARGITTTFSYDGLNRLTGKSYSNGDPAVSYAYDQGVNGIGRRTGMADQAGSEAWSYDTMGRIVSDQRTTSGVSKTAAYTYNLDGSEASITYPSGHTITYTPNGAGQTVSAVDAANSIAYASSAHYSPAGVLSSLTNGTSLVSTFSSNNRLQPCRISVTSNGAAPSSCSDTTNIGNILDYSYNFSLGTADNGNVTTITNNRDNTRSQSFTYDALNRLASAQTQSTTGSNCWGLSFGYDAWGNLLSSTSSGSAGCGEPFPLNVSVTFANGIAGYCYDAAGNLLQQGSCPASAPYQYNYNAENQMTSTSGVNYLYDGDGKRVAKSNGKLYWYGILSSPLDESDSNGNVTNEYVFFNGQRIARRDSSNNIVYYFADHLGTARVTAIATGGILDDSDFYPFGGERPVISSSGNPYKFTGKERDSESGLDNFIARYESSSLGRFMSADPGPWIFLNPQSYNGYSYGLNNPLRFSDDSGQTAQDRVNAANNFAAQNIPYVFGGKNPSCGLDCSGFVQNVFKADPDNTIPVLDTVQSAASQATDLQNGGEFSTDINNAKPGDAIFFSDSDGNIAHTGIVVSVQDGKIYFVHAPKPGDKVKKGSVSTRRGVFGNEKFAGVGRPNERNPQNPNQNQNGDKVGFLNSLVNLFESFFFKSTPPPPPPVPQESVTSRILPCTRENGCN